MENKCMVCEETKCLKRLTDEKYMFFERIDEIFNIKLEYHDVESKLKICKQCILSLNSSYEFYCQVKNATEKLKSTDTVLVKIEIKEEAPESNGNDDFSLYRTFNSPLSYKEDDDSEQEPDEEKVILISHTFVFL